MAFTQSFTLARDQFRKLARLDGKKAASANAALDRLHRERRLLERASSEARAFNNVEFELTNAMGIPRGLLAEGKLKGDELILVKEELDDLILRRDANEARRSRCLHQAGVLKKRIDSCERLLSNGRLEQCALIFAPPIKNVDTVDASTVRKELKNLGGKIDQMVADRREAETAPLDRATAKKIVSAALDKLATPPFVGRIVEGTESEIYFPAGPSGEGSPRVPDTLGFLTWLLRDQIEQRLNAMVDSEADDERALTPQDRVARIAKLDADKLAAERLHEAYAGRGLSLGLEIGLDANDLQLRADADPRAILGLADDPLGPPDSMPQEAKTAQQVADEQRIAGQWR